MITKINKYIAIVVLFGLLSCKKNSNYSELIFSQICNFSGSSVEVVNKLSGTLSYTDNISGYSLGDVRKFVIYSADRLPMIVCNMPAEFEMEEGASRNVTFGGRVLVLPEEVDALNTDIELNYLKFE